MYNRILLFTSLTSFRDEKYLIKNDICLKKLKLLACTDNSYPLRNKISSKIFVVPNSKNITKSVHESHNIHDESLILDINDIYEDMAIIMNSSIKKINSLDNYIHINKLICMFKLHLKRFNDVLKDDKLNITPECIRVNDMLFLERRTKSYKTILSLFDAK